jgi:hypothetical protein
MPARVGASHSPRRWCWRCAWWSAPSGSATSCRWATTRRSRAGSRRWARRHQHRFGLGRDLGGQVPGAGGQHGGVGDRELAVGQGGGGVGQGAAEHRPGPGAAGCGASRRSGGAWTPWSAPAGVDGGRFGQPVAFQAVQQPPQPQDRLGPGGVGQAVQVLGGQAVDRGGQGGQGIALLGDGVGGQPVPQPAEGVADGLATGSLECVFEFMGAT